MRLEDLKLFIIIADCGNLRRAAQEAKMTQPGLTKVLQRLEAELGLALFERTSRGLVVTEVGATFLDRVRRVDVQLDHALKEVEDIRFGELGHLRIGTTSSFVEGILTPTMLGLLTDRPAAKYRLSVNATVPMLQQLVAGQLDLVLAGVPRTIDPELEFEQLLLEPMHVVCRENHPLMDATTKDIVRLAEALWILPPKGRMGRNWLEERLLELKLPPPKAIIETDLSTALLRNLLVNTDLLAPLSQSVLRSTLGIGLQTLEPLFGQWREPMAIFWRRGAYLSPLSLEFRRRISKAASAAA